jgi:hypothetical protein
MFVADVFAEDATEDDVDGRALENGQAATAAAAGLRAVIARIRELEATSTVISTATPAAQARGYMREAKRHEELGRLYGEVGAWSRAQAHAAQARNFRRWAKDRRQDARKRRVTVRMTVGDPGYRRVRKQLILELRAAQRHRALTDPGARPRTTAQRHRSGRARPTASAGRRRSGVVRGARSPGRSGDNDPHPLAQRRAFVGALR